jgi:hypothetical protein
MTRIGVNEVDELIAPVLIRCADRNDTMRACSLKFCYAGLFGATTWPVSCSRFPRPDQLRAAERDRAVLGNGSAHLEEFG